MVLCKDQQSNIEGDLIKWEKAFGTVPVYQRSYYKSFNHPAQTKKK